MTRGAFAGERALVVGWGSSGRAAAAVLLAEGASVRVSESGPARHPRDAPPEGVEVMAGGHLPDHLDGATVVVSSPGVPEGAPIIRWALQRGLPVWSELELGARLCRVPFVAVTGTNGKTTTTELVAAMMKAAGLRARACGNVGYPFSLAAREPFDALAVEASSFQLRFQESLHPRVSVLLNLAPDHLDWHGSFDAYARAKERVFRRQSGDDVHVGNRDDDAAAAISRRAPCPVRWFGWGDGRGDEVVASGGAVVSADGNLRLACPPGSTRAFLTDAAAAAAAGLSFGLPAEAVREALRRPPAMEHRGSVVATVGGVAFVDDSKATNPHAALTALDGKSETVLIAGGRAKGVDLSPLSAAAPGLAGVVAIGEAGPEVSRVFEGLVPVVPAATMEEAVAAAFALSAPGGTVLLAPACASQDMFRDYRDRGDRFAAAAKALGPHAGGAPVRAGRRMRRDDA